jgi:hypothetical protein
VTIELLVDAEFARTKHELLHTPLPSLQQQAALDVLKAVTQRSLTLALIRAVVSPYQHSKRRPDIKPLAVFISRVTCRWRHDLQPPAHDPVAVPFPTLALHERVRAPARRIDQSHA